MAWRDGLVGATGARNAGIRGGPEGWVADRWWLGAARGTLERSRSGMNASSPSAFEAWGLAAGQSSRIETGS